MSGLNLSMFRAYDIRTPAYLLTPELSRRLARAEAWYFREELCAEGVLLSRDSRLTGAAYLECAAEEYMAAGLDVCILPAPTSTPLLYFAAMTRPSWASVMIGASHNPAPDTGRKICATGLISIAKNSGPLGGLDHLKELYLAEMRVLHPGRIGRLTVYDPLEEYIETSMDLSGVKPGSLKDFPVFLDFLHGSAGREILGGFEAAGADVQALHYSADGLFPLGDPNPVKKNVIQPGLDCLKSGGFQLGMFYDGDGDRIDFYDSKGSHLASSSMYSAMLPLMKEHARERLTVFADIKALPSALIEIAKKGFQVMPMRSGHSQIKTALAAHHEVLGAVEESAHYYETFEHAGKFYSTENSLYFSMLAARLFNEDPSIQHHLTELQSRTHRLREWGYKFADEEKLQSTLDECTEVFKKQGFDSITSSPIGIDLDAVLLRKNMPMQLDEKTAVADNWIQVAVRRSHSEDALARFEVSAGDLKLAEAAKDVIAQAAAKNQAGEEYHG